MLPDCTPTPILERVRHAADELDCVRRLADAGELAAMGLVEERDRYAVKELFHVIGDRLAGLNEALAPGGRVVS